MTTTTSISAILSAALFSLPTNLMAMVEGDSFTFCPAPGSKMNVQVTFTLLENHILLQAKDLDNNDIHLGCQGIKPRIQGLEIEQCFNWWVQMNPSFVPAPAPKPAPKPAAAPAPKPALKGSPRPVLQEGEDFLAYCRILQAWKEANGVML